MCDEPPVLLHLSSPSPPSRPLRGLRGQLGSGTKVLGYCGGGERRVGEAGASLKRL